MRRRLLLADDSVAIQRVIELTFSGEDVEVITVSDGDQAIARIPVDKPDIILADIGMPRRSGYEVCAFVKQRPDLAHVPVLLLAGAFEPVDEARVKQVRCDGVLVKPFEPQQVITRVRDLIGHAAAAVPAPESTPGVSAPPPVDVAPSAVHPEPELARPEIGVSSAAQADSSLDSYFDRLDAAFATLGNTQSGAGSPPPGLSASELLSVPSAPAPLPREEDSFVVPTIDELLGGGLRQAAPDAETPVRVQPPPLEPPDAPDTPAPSPGATFTPGGESGNLIADAFNALFAVERGEADPATVRLAPPPAGVAVTDELIDEVTRRVMARLAPEAARTLVADVVSEVAERLVREEIERVRNRK